MNSYYEFFAGGGMVRAGLGKGWQCLFANDFDYKKCFSYQNNWGSSEIEVADIRNIRASDLPGKANLAWASFPCQDLSLAGGGAGLRGERSGTYWPFWSLVQALTRDMRAPEIIVLENVCGTLTSHGGQDFSVICDNYRKAGYVVGAVVIDASLFVPQSRPRLFVVGVRSPIETMRDFGAEEPNPRWHTRSLMIGYDKLSRDTKRNWIWWRLPEPPKRLSRLSTILEDNAADLRWFSQQETQRLIGMMSPLNREKLKAARQMGRRIVGCVYKRTRPDELGRKIQRAEIRFDDVSGCLRTPAGGSSRQVIIVVEGNVVRARLISSRETARLMGLPDSYRLPENYNEAYHLTGDGVVVPVIRHLAANLFEPVLRKLSKKSTVAA